MTIWTPERDLLFRIKKYRDLVIPARGHIGMAGFYRIEAMAENGHCRWLTPWFHNNITNLGLDLCATSESRYAACHVGTGTADPDNSDTALVNYLAGTSTNVLVSRTYVGAPENYTESYIRYDFDAGAAAGNIAEVGISPGASNGSGLFSRELIRDADGDPTTITIASTESLRVHYKIRHYPPLVDVTGTVNGSIDGSPGTRDFTRRAARIAAPDYWGPTEGGRSATCKFGIRATSFSGNHSIVSTGDIGAITSSPSGTSYQSTGAGETPYSSGSYSKSYYASWNTSTANANLKSYYFEAGGRYTGYGTCYGAAFQVSFADTLNKTNLQTLTLETLISWGRYTPP